MKKWNALFMLMVMLIGVSTYADSDQKIKLESGEWNDQINIDEFRKWRQKNEQRLNDALIYLPTNKDVELLNQLLMFSGSGFGPGNGGSDLLFEMDSLAKEVLSIISLNPAVFPEVNILKFEEALKKTLIFFVDKLPGSETRFVQALNWKEHDLILVKKDAWVSFSHREKLKIVLHEYLGILGIEENNAHISNRLDNKGIILKAGVNKEWEGKRYIYSNRNNSDYIVKINLKPKTQNGLNEGKIVTKYGSSFAEYIFNGNYLSVILKNKVSYTLEVYRFSSVDFNTYAITVERSLKSLNVLEDEDLIKHVDQVWEVCEYGDPSLPRDILDDLKPCHLELERIDDGLIKTKEILTEKFDTKNVSIAALPIFDHFSPQQITYALVEIRNGVVQYLDGIDEIINDKVVEFDLKPDFLSLKLNSGININYKKLRSLIGFDRVISEYHDSTSERIYMEALVLSEGLVSNIGRDSLVGSYSAQYVNVKHTNEEYELYDFNDDGYGGFNTTAGHNIFWKWNYLSGVLYANRYMYLTSFSDGTSGSVRNAQQQKECDSNIKYCHLFNARKYYLLKNKGHRFTMLRSFEYLSHTDQQGIIDSKSLSLWVMDKY